MEKMFDYAIGALITALIGGIAVLVRRIVRIQTPGAKYRVFSFDFSQGVTAGAAVSPTARAYPGVGVLSAEQRCILFR